MKKHLQNLIIFSLALTSCAPSSHSGANEAVKVVAKNIAQDISCKNQSLENNLWDGLKSILIEQKTIPTSRELKAELQFQLRKLTDTNPNQDAAQWLALNNDLDQLIEILLVEAPQGERIETPEQLLGLLSAIDVGDRTTAFRSYLQDKVRSVFASLSKTIKSLDLKCEPSRSLIQEESASPLANPDYDYQKQQALAAGVPLSVFGERWAFATAYQTCQSLQMNPLDAKTSDIQGISIIGKHSDGVGNKRVIANLSLVQATHPYIKEVTSYGESCFNVRNNPLIYDYGGKPYATTAANAPIDLFKNNGDGTSVLGIDCSGFVFTSMAAAGLKLKSGRALKAVDSWAWGSTAYVEPQSNGLTCLDKITVKPGDSLHAGDIVAVPGHVILIDKVGADPFGISGVSSEKDCAALNASRFDFVVAQSSPSVGAVGINHFEARDYLPTSAKMNAGLQKYAYYACLAKVNNKSYTPNLGTLSGVRHRGTSDCVAPRVSLARESCIQSCPAASFAN